MPGSDTRPAGVPRAWYARIGARGYAAAGAAIVGAAAIALWHMGQVPICKCGYVKAWHGVVASAENSQHLSDWYTFSHVIHGFAFYGLLWVAGRHWPVALRLVLALAIEAAWEVFENTDERFQLVSRFGRGDILRSAVLPKLRIALDAIL